MRVAITGAAGFVGSHLVDHYLAAGAHVIGIDDLSTGRLDNLRSAVSDPRFRFVTCDVSSGGDAVTRIFRDEDEVNLVLHFASPASPADYARLPLHTLRVNSAGTEAMLDVARRYGAGFVFASTSEVYGDPAVSPQNEEYWGNVNPRGERSCYDEAKRYGEALVASYVRVHRVRARVVRIFNTYGPRLRPGDGRVVPNFISQALAGKPLTVYGDGLQTRSFCYVDDLVAGITRLAASEAAIGRTVNIGNPNEITVRELAEVVADLAGVPLATLRRPLPPDDPTRRRPDITLANELLGWAPQVSLREGLRRTIDAWPSTAAVA